MNIQGFTTTPGVLSAILHAPDTVRLRMLGSVACRGESPGLINRYVSFMHPRRHDPTLKPSATQLHPLPTATPITVHHL